MRYTWRIGKIPDGNTALANQSVAVRKISDGTTITTLTTDANGFVTLQADGHYEPFYLHLAGVPGGDKYWRSDESHTVSVFTPKEFPVAMRLLGDGVIRGYGSELAATLTAGGPSFTIADGAANVAGHPFVQYTSSTAFTVSRPVTSTRIDRIIIRLYPEGSATTPGQADVAVLAGVEGAAATALTQSATVYEMDLYTLTVPTAGAITLTDARVFANELTPVTGITRSDAETTTSAGGAVLTNLNTSLVLPRTGTYDVEAWVSALQDNGGGWVLQLAAGSFGAGTAPNFSGPRLHDVDSSGNVWIPDYGNNRIVKLNSSGAYVTAITGLSTPYGVAIDGSDNLYVTYANNRMAKYNSSLVLQWDVAYGALASVLAGLTTATTLGYVAAPANNKIYSFNLATGAATLLLSTSGSGNGQLATPFDVVTDGASLYVCDQGNGRIQQFTVAGAYVTKWGSTGVVAGQFNTPAGLDLDASGSVWVADPGNNRMQQFSSSGTYLASITQPTPYGLAIASGDVIWISNALSHYVAKWDEAAGGYGGLAIEIDGNLSSYITLGDVKSMLQTSYTHTATGPATISVKLYGKASSGTATFRSVVLSTRAVPRV